MSVYMQRGVRYYPPAPIEGEPGQRGELVFWRGTGPEPWWIVEWQPNNGSCYAIVNAAGVIGTAGGAELTRDFRKARG